MKRPRTAHEPVSVETIPVEGTMSPALADLVAVTMFQLGHVAGRSPTSRVHVVLDESGTEDFVLRVTVTISREEIEACVLRTT